MAFSLDANKMRIKFLLWFGEMILINKASNIIYSIVSQVTLTVYQLSTPPLLSSEKQSKSVKRNSLNSKKTTI